MSDGDRVAETGDGWIGLRVQVALLTLALLLLVGFQTTQLIRDRTNLATVHAAQEPTVQEGLKLRQQLDILAGETARLAAEGDAAARAIIEDMRRQGITVKVPAAK
jgi:hypothetical protein